MTAPCEVRGEYLVSLPKEVPVYGGQNDHRTFCGRLLFQLTTLYNRGLPNLSPSSIQPLSAAYPLRNRIFNQAACPPRSLKASPARVPEKGTLPRYKVDPFAYQRG